MLIVSLSTQDCQGNAPWNSGDGSFSIILILQSLSLGFSQAKENADNIDKRLFVNIFESLSVDTNMMFFIESRAPCRQTSL